MARQFAFERMKNRMCLRGVFCVFALAVIVVVLGLLSQKQNRSTELPEVTKLKIEAASSTPTVAAAPPAIERFAAWSAEYLRAATAEQRADMEEAGLAFARERRAEMRQLIQTDPKRALELALPVSVRQQLPTPVQGLLEKRIDAHGDYNVLGAVPAPGKEGQVPPITRSAAIDGKEYRAFVYGARAELPTRKNQPFNGIAVDDVIALSDKLYRDVEPAERTALNLVPGEAICAVSGDLAVANNEPTPVDVGGKVVWLCGSGHREELNRHLMASAAQLGGGGAEGEVSESPYTEGRKRLLMIRVAFSDLPTPDISVSQLVPVHAAVDTYWRICSFGHTSLAELGKGSDIVQVTLATNYASFNDRAIPMRDAVRQAATAQGIDLSKYDFDAIYTGGGRPSFDFGGLGYVGGPGAWVVGASRGISCHELGHNLGFPHANFWDTGGQSAIGTGGNQEYGDPYDVMGGGGVDDGTGPGQYVSKFKWWIGWIPDEDFPFINTSGLYRIYAHDNPDTSGLRGVRFTRDGSLDYYLEFRQRYTSNPWLMNGIGLRWGSKGGSSSQLIDTTPGTSDGKNDSAIVIGRTFSDPQANVHITPVAKGNTYPESIDVVVNFGPFPTNQAPRVIVSASSPTAGVNGLVTFNAAASDPNGDALAYCWEFGDGTFSSNSPVVVKSWATANDYVVRCFVSDMKGGTAIDSTIVRVGSPSTFTLSGRVLSDGKPLGGVLVSASSSRYTYTDSDGTYTISRLNAGSYTLSALSYPYIFAAPFFANPIAVGPSKSNLDFVTVATPLSGGSIVASNSVWKYLDNGSNQGTNWINPDFDDNLWASGPAQLGYGDGDEATVINYGPSSSSKYITYYFRQAFQLSDPTTFTNYSLRLLRDDGAVVYLNGKEILRDNMPAGVITYTTLASANSEATTVVPVQRSAFVPGRNVLAVEVHQDAGNSSDVSFQLGITATAISNISQIAVVYIASPAENAIYRGPTNIVISANPQSTTTSFNLVEFFANGGKIGQLTAAPFNFTWNSAPIGAHVLTVVARDTAGNNLTSAPVNISVVAPAPSMVASLIPTGAVWKYSDTGTDYGTNWQHLGFDDSGWPSGAARLGYGDGDESTVVSYGPDENAKHITTYFRRSFYVPDPSDVATLQLRLLRDDGGIVYLNGTEVYRNNLPLGAVDYSTLALSEQEADIYYPRIVNPRYLVAGINVIAVGMHQYSITDPDLSFDFDLTGTLSTNRAPGAYLTSPAHGAEFFGNVDVDVSTIAVPVEGETITQVAYYDGTSPIGDVQTAPYAFTWTSPPFGVHQLRAVALQGNGQSLTSAPVNIRISAPPVGEQLVSPNSRWRYLDDGSDQGAAWTAPAFNDAAWAEGYARLGYGGDGENTTLSFGNDAQKKYITTFFRRKFEVTDPAAFGALKLLLTRDDGAVVYLNGTEVYRSNLREGRLSYNSLALNTVDGAEEQALLETPLSPDSLVTGENVIAVEIHQAAITSSDLGFDLALIGEQATNVVNGIYLATPANGAHVTLPDTIGLSAFARFSTPITSVDFLANGQKIGEASALPFDFAWDNAASGDYVLTAVAHSSTGASITSPPVHITVSGPPLLITPVAQTFFTSGSTWSYWPNAAAPPTNWNSPSYDPVSWPVGAARFGFGLDGEATTLPSGRTTYYFRRSFNVPNPALLDQLVIQLQRDDGAVVYVNGNEVLRSNMPEGPIANSTAALSLVEGLDEQQFFIYNLAAGGLLPGSNLIAVELHQAVDTRLDLGFDLYLSALGTTAPRVVVGRPANNAIFRVPASVPLEAFVWPGQGRNVAKVEFFADGAKIGEATSAPYSFVWNTSDRGVKEVTARATDDFGSTVDSAPVALGIGLEKVALTLVPSGATWRYLDNGSNQGTNWTRVNAVDSFWKVGAARLGYGGDGEATTVSYGPNVNQKYITTYFRHAFLAPSNVTITNLIFRLIRDDGAVVWFNGVEAFRSNMPLGPVSYTTLASTAVGGIDELTSFSASFGVTNLQATNLVAVEVHQNGGTSSDLGFDLEVVGSGYRLQAYAPQPSVALLANGNLEISWDAGATGWNLFSSDQLGSGAWDPVVQPPVLRGNRKVLELTPAPGSRFYRLGQ